MTDWSEYVAHYLEQHRRGDGDAFFSLIDGSDVLGPLADAFHSEESAEAREFILDVVREHRRPQSFELLAEGLEDEEERVWKSALDGLVTLGLTMSKETALSVLQSARGRLDSGDASASVRREWLDEAIEQTRNPTPPLVEGNDEGPA